MEPLQPLISIIIPVKNGAMWLRKTLNAIFLQSLIPETEVIIIESGSTDDSLMILKEFPVRIVATDPDKFNHGESRNLGIKNARGKYVVLTVQDAEPAGTDWLKKLVDGFDSDRVAGVCGQQVVPHDVDKNPIDWFRPISVPRKRKYVLSANRTFNQLTPMERMQMCAWDNVNAMYRRDILLQVPFRKVSFAEDAYWAKDALIAGYEIVYNPMAQVNHYHFETPDFVYRRKFTVHFHFYDIFGLRPVPEKNGMWRVLADGKILLLERRIKWKHKMTWLLYNYRRRKASNRATSVFLETLKKNPKGLIEKHTEICAKPPQAPPPDESSFALPGSRA